MPRRLLLTLACLLSFLLQSYVAQTHIHIPRSGDAAIVSHGVSAAPVAGHRAPDSSRQDDLSKCPACQMVSAAGAALAPTLFHLAPLSPDSLVIAFHQAARPGNIEPAHVWHSRGPPLR